MTFWDFCDHHIVLTGFVVFTIVPLAFLLAYDLGTLWYNAHRNGVIAKITAAKKEETNDG